MTERGRRDGPSGGRARRDPGTSGGAAPRGGRGAGTGAGGAAGRGAGRHGTTGGASPGVLRPDRPVVAAAGPGGVAGIAERPGVHLSDDIVRELKATARPGKGEILVKVFAEAGAAFADDDIDEAIRLGEQAKHIALRAPTVRELLGLAFYRAGRFKEAARELAAFKRLTGSVAQNPVIADCYRAQGNLERALALCDEVGAAEVEEAVLFESAIVAAGALRDARRVDEAIARLQTLDLDPPVAREHHLRAWYVLGDLLERRGRYTQARELFEAVDAVDPDLTDAAERLRPP